jgi:hypothetical protein
MTIQSSRFFAMSFKGLPRYLSEIEVDRQPRRP